MEISKKYINHSRDRLEEGGWGASSYSYVS